MQWTLAERFRPPTAFSGPFTVQQHEKWYWAEGHQPGNVGAGWTANPDFATEQEVARVELEHALKV